MSKTNSRYVYYRPGNDAAAQQALVQPPAIVVEKADGQYPRSYEEAPALVSVMRAGNGTRETLIRVPVDYKGHHTVPPGATKLDDINAALADAALAKGGRSGQVLSGGGLVGTALPDDYDPVTAHHVTPRFKCRDANEGTRLYRVPFSQLEKVRAVLENPDEHQQDRICKSLLAADGKTLPELVEMRNGAYLVYENTPGDVKLPIDGDTDLGEYERAREFEEQMQQMFGGDRDHSVTDSVETLVRVDHAEFAWIAADARDIKNNVRLPEPPVALNDLYCSDHFRARGASFDALEDISTRQAARSKAEKELEVALFGPPSLKQSFEVQGRTFATYDSKLHPVYDGDGQAIGIRCDWTPLRPDYTGMKNVDPPAGWEELKAHPGVFAPNPATNPDDVEKLAALSWPDCRDYPAAFGGPEPVIRIEHNDKATYPRAYRDYSRVHALQDENGPLYYIDAPTDYKGAVFHPEGAERLTKFEYGLLVSGMGDMYEPAYQLRPEGVATPKDYQFDPPELAEQQTRYFTLAGRSKQIYDAFEKEREAIAEARRKFVESVGGSGGYSYQGAKIISVEFEEDVPPHWLVEREHKATNIDDDGNLVDVARYTCVPDTKTPEGRELARRMAEDFNAEPDLRDLQARWTPNAPHMPHPQWKPDDGEPVFFYAVKDIKGGPLAPPPDAVELKPWMTEWITRDRTDRMSGVKPPPMPPQIKQALQKMPKRAPKQPGPPA